MSNTWERRIFWLVGVFVIAPAAVYLAIWISEVL